MNPLNPMTGDAGDADGTADAESDAELEAELEAELAALRPNGLPTDLSRRIRRGVMVSRRAEPARRFAIGLAACLAIVAAVAIALAVRHHPDHDGGTIVHHEPPKDVPDRGPSQWASAKPPVGPRPGSVADYRGALTQSSEALDARLDAEARRPWSGGTAEVDRAGVLTSMLN